MTIISDTCFIFIRIEYFQLEGTYSDYLGQLPDHFRAHQKLKHIIKSIVQMPLKH